MRISVENELVLTDARVNGIDTSNVLKTFTAGQKINYTATQECYAIFTLNHEDYGNNTAYLDGVVIAGCDGNKRFATAGIYLKEGQVLTTTGKIPSQQSRPGYVYGIKR